MILFEENWKQEVREYLRPFLGVSPSPSAEELKGDWSVYNVEVIGENEPNNEWFLSDFRLGDNLFNHLARNDGEGGNSEITWALKSNMPSPLCFWAAAEVINTISFSSGAWFDYRLNPSPIAESNDSEELNLVAFARCYWHYGEKRSRLEPAIIQEKEIRHWLIRDEWNDQSTLFETEEHFVLWNWSTGA